MTGIIAWCLIKICLTEPLDKTCVTYKAEMPLQMIKNTITENLELKRTVDAHCVPIRMEK